MDSGGKTSRAINKMDSFASHFKDRATVTRNATQNMTSSNKKHALPNIDLRKRSVRMKDNNFILKPPILNFGGKNDNLVIESITERSEKGKKNKEFTISNQSKLEQNNSDNSKCRDDDTDFYLNQNYKNGSSNAKYPHNLPKQNTKNLSTKKPDSISDIYLKIVNSSESDEQNNPRKSLENLFKIICIGDGPEIFHIKHCNLNRNNLKLFLSKRYPPKLAERLTLNIFASTPSSYQMNYTKFIDHFSNFLKSPIHLIQLFCFKCYDISGKGNICEHDIFQIFQHCKEYIPLKSYITLLEDEKLYNDVDSMIKDTKSDLFTNVFVPDITKISELIYKKKMELIEMKEIDSTTDEEQYLGLKGYLELDANTIMGQAFKRYKMSSDILKPTCDFTINVFDHKNIFNSTASKLPPCVTLNEDDFLSLDFDFGIPNLFNDFVKYLTNGFIDTYEHFKKETIRIKYIERMNALSPSSRQHHQQIPVTYSQEDLNSVKFWNLVDLNLFKDDGVQFTGTYEQFLLDRKRKKSHQLPEGHEHIALREYIQYFEKSHMKFLEK